MSTDIGPVFEASLTPDGHQALLAVAANNGVDPSAVLGVMLQAFEPYLLDAAAMMRGMAVIRAEFDAALARQMEVIDLFGPHADMTPFVDAIADTLVKLEKLRRAPRTGPLVNALPVLPTGG